MKKSTVRFLSAAAVILPVVVLSCACAMVQMLLSGVPSAVVAGVLGLVMYVIWAGGIVWTIVRHLRGASLVLSLLLLCSLALFAVAYAMDYGLFSMKGTLWTIGQLCGSPMYILTDGIEKLTRMENGAAAILAALAYLLPCIAGTAYAAGRDKR